MRSYDLPFESVNLKYSMQSKYQKVPFATNLRSKRAFNGIFLILEEDVKALPDNLVAKLRVVTQIEFTRSGHDHATISTCL